MPPDQILSFFAKYIESELGIVYAEHNYFQLQNRLGEIAKLMGVQSVEQLHIQALGGICGPFKQLLLDIATNNETSFFRDPKVFRALENTLSKLLASRSTGSGRLLIWSSASSSGQEALSIAILLKEWSKNRNQNLDFKIIGTDISEQILTKAKNARYSQLEVQRGLPSPLLLKYFTKDENENWTANSDVTRHIEYRSLNLTDRFSFHEKFDLIFCRNVLIYQNIDRKIEILKRLHAAMTAEGVLILGSGESVIGLSDDFRHLNLEGAVIYLKKEALALSQTTQAA